jgi:hypothetical protein
MTEAHPYQDLPPRAYWRTGVALADRLAFPDLYSPRIRITPATRVATAGSCFAQHIGRALVAAGCAWQEAEPPPPQMPRDLAETFGYALFSARTGNIYTARALRQLLEEIVAGIPDPSCVWAREDRFIDAFRPTVEPEGLATPDEVLLLRDYHLERTARMLTATDVFIFTLGLTEAWEDGVTGRVYPVCPGVAGGNFDPARHRFVNFTTAQVLADLIAIHALLRRFNPGMALMLTVSPVPLTATASGEHVLTATTLSKAVLRAAAGEFVAGRPGTDYFPSFELVTHPAAGGPWFAPNLRSVTPEGVARVMSVFLAAQGLASGTAAPDSTPAEPEEDAAEDDVICDDLLLQAFAPCPDPSA